MRELFRDADLAVRAHSAAGGGRAALVVAFDHHRAEDDLDLPGFGERYLVGRGIAAVAVRSRGNRWYQHPGTAAALAAVAAHAAGHDRTVTYGSSMGGYAAWRFAGLVGAQGCLALSPQYSLDPAKVPWEARWAQEASRIAWRPALDGAPAGACVPVVAFDPRGPDRRHAELIAAAGPAVLLPLPFAGHPVATFLNSAGLLEPLLDAVIADRLDPGALRRAAAARRRGDPAFLVELSGRLARRRPALALALARQARAVHPDSDLVLHTLARRLDEAGERAAALALHARAAAGGFEGFRLAHGQALEAAGDLAGALAVAEALAAEQPDRAHIVSWLGQLRWAAGDQRAALACAAAAAALSPLEAHYAATLAIYRARRAPLRRLRRWLAAAARRWPG